MNPLIRTLYGSRRYFIAFTVYLLLSFIFWSLHSKADGFILMNGKHSAGTELFFSWFTYLGDGLFTLLLFVLLLLARQLLQAVHLLLAYVYSGLLVQLIKHVTHMPRPKVFLHANQYDQFIEGISRGGWSSFPSGHTTTAFAVATVLALYANNKWWRTFYLMAAILVGYSRIYLGHHFLEDVLAGSIMGVFIAACVVAWMPELKLFGRRVTGPLSSTPVVYNN